FAKSLKYDANGLIPVIVQDYKDNQVLMLAYMNSKAVELTLKTRKATFWSRSRKKFWVKGETSGNIQKVKEVSYDCDKDALLVKAVQVGGAACHTGYRSCFFTKISSAGKHTVCGKRVFNPKDIYK
ncbi:MAG: phosphoribosyl-AMP cyclohydrolase, partial [Elusimicrobia bacterium RIFOXYB1_FULL_48_9]